MFKSFFRFAMGAVAYLALCIPLAQAEVCSAILPSLKLIEHSEGVYPVTGLSLGLGEDSCRFDDSRDELSRKITCDWKNSEDRTWTTDDARDIGVQLNNTCSFLTLHFSGPRHAGADYFLWYGDFTGVSVKHTSTGMRLTIQIDEEAYYYS